ncbi:potassium-transporting ATPase subunit F [Novosphingobium colocasiae]
MPDLSWLALLGGLFLITLAFVRLCEKKPEETAMTLPLALAGLTAAGLLVYLVAVLVRPERF